MVVAGVDLSPRMLLETLSWAGPGLDTAMKTCLPESPVQQGSRGEMRTRTATVYPGEGGLPGG